MSIINSPKVVNKKTGEVLSRVRNQGNNYLYEQDFEKNLEPSMTKPGQTMTVLEMVQRHRKGLPIDQSKGALYQGEELLPNLDNMDLVDRANYIDSVADALVEIRAKLAESAKTKQQKEFLDKVDEEVRNRLSKIRDNANESDGLKTNDNNE